MIGRDLIVAVMQIEGTSSVINIGSTYIVINEVQVTSWSDRYGSASPGDDAFIGFVHSLMNEYHSIDNHITMRGWRRKTFENYG